MNPKVRLIRYADDFVISGYSKELLESEVKPLVAEFLAARGLVLSDEKTRITHIDEGFDFLGQNVRKYHGKLLIKPSARNIKACVSKIRELVKGNKTAKQETLIQKLNPVIRGWANYHQHVVAKQCFQSMDRDVWRALWQWARRRHPNKNGRWIRERYFKIIGARTWVFAAESADVRPSGRGRLHELWAASKTPIRRHTKIKADANPFDPAWKPYFEARAGLRMRNKARRRKDASGMSVEMSVPETGL